LAPQRCGSATQALRTGSQCVPGRQLGTITIFGTQAFCSASQCKPAAQPGATQLARLASGTSPPTQHRPPEVSRSLRQHAPLLSGAKRGAQAGGGGSQVRPPPGFLVGGLPVFLQTKFPDAAWVGQTPPGGIGLPSLHPHL
jgi:hypothetical protein